MKNEIESMCLCLGRLFESIDRDLTVFLASVTGPLCGTKEADASWKCHTSLIGFIWGTRSLLSVVSSWEQGPLYNKGLQNAASCNLLSSFTGFNVATKTPHDPHPPLRSRDAHKTLLSTLHVTVQASWVAASTWRSVQHCTQCLVLYSSNEI